MVDDVRLTVTAMQEYASALETTAGDMLSQLHGLLGETQSLGPGAFLTESPGGVLAEGSLMDSVVRDTTHAFQQFLTDLTAGVSAIAQAAATLAQGYEKTDSGAAAAITAARDGA